MRLLIFSNIYIALAAVCLTYQTYYLVGAAPHSVGLLALVFFATLSIYNLDRLVSSSREDAVELTERHRWIAEHTRWLWGLAAVGAIGTAASLLWVPMEVLYGLVPLGVISLAYSLPFLVRGDKKLRLKDVPGLKIFLIALVWGCVTVVLPALDAEVSPLDADVMWASVERILFIFAITLPFDVRDLARDRQSGIRTLPMALGAQKTRWLAVGLMAVFCAVALGHYGLQWQAPTVPMLAAGVLTLVALWFSDQVRSELYYVGVLDGTMILQGALVVGYMQLFS